MIQLRECELGAIVNRDLQRRVRPVSGVTLERPVLRADARLAARLAHLLDTRTNLWDSESKHSDSDNTQQNEVGIVFLLFCTLRFYRYKLNFIAVPIKPKTMLIV